MIYEYRGSIYPDYLKTGNAARFIEPARRHFCRGMGFDVGCGDWPVDGAIPIDSKRGDDAMALPDVELDYVFSSHCLEHLPNPIAALRHWQSRIKPGGVLFLYLPHPEMEYWLPQNLDKHLHSWTPEQMKKIVIDLGFEDVIASERDLNWSFCVVGRKA